jgi:hypothetical protein
MEPFAIDAYAGKELKLVIGPFVLFVSIGAWSMVSPSATAKSSLHHRLILLTALLGLACGSVLAQAINPNYTNDLPSVERVKAEIKGSDPTDTLARQVAVFSYLAIRRAHQIQPHRPRSLQTRRTARHSRLQPRRLPNLSGLRQIPHPRRSQGLPSVFTASTR